MFRVANMFNLGQSGDDRSIKLTVILMLTDRARARSRNGDAVAVMQPTRELDVFQRNIIVFKHMNIETYHMVPIFKRERDTLGISLCILCILQPGNNRRGSTAWRK